MIITKEQISSFAEKCESEFDLSNAKLPMEYFYSNLVFAVLDAVFSIGARYAAVKNVVNNYSKYIIMDNEHRISDFIKVYEEHGSKKMAEEIIKNKQRTSSRNGILKIDACYEIAKILKSYDIETKKDFNIKINEELISEILQVKGQGSGIMLKYLIMLVGDDNVCKPDRHIRRYVAPFLGEKATDQDIQNLFTEAVKILKIKYPNITVRLLDNRIWNKLSRYAK